MTSTTPLRHSFPVTAALLMLLAIPLACTRPSLPGDLKVGEITTGRTLAPDGSITEDSRTNSFWTTDTFYVSVATEGSAQNVELKARWTGPASAESTKTISPTGPLITAFEAPPKDGRWPEGDYKVEILVNGVSQATKELVAR